MQDIKNILLVEDEPSMSRLISFKLEKENFKVDVAADGEKALQKFLDETISYDAIILDLMLPILDGMQVLKKIREENKEIPVLVLSAKSQKKDVLDGLNKGADDYLTKPFRPEELTLRLKKLLGES
ncbi:response regulator transcription factor [Natranaerofaba carboxydovora]|uniref:response regulator transcription factor n=1 Tax=Natranaerofaba carboxydovora TaxID=2742683 RepID=UPI001F12F30C|nr:response regulator transcription factor [Natranaerofaba carboxydovora]UMZ72667.1 Response regulator ArlR [Natranaerofaba carboxydovora]